MRFFEVDVMESRMLVRRLKELRPGSLVEDGDSSGITNQGAGEDAETTEPKEFSAMPWIYIYGGLKPGEPGLYATNHAGLHLRDSFSCGSKKIPDLKARLDEALAATSAR